MKFLAMIEKSIWQDTDKMASIRRTDIMHKKYSKGRPAKPERERVNKRQEAYKWRDARRVYLASSFDRWRKLRSSLKLKDSSLAWHLMEAHEKGQCAGCRLSECETSEGRIQRKKCDQKEFLPSLISSIRQLCHTHFHFNECIEIVGLLCLEFDKSRKENFSLNELIKSGSKPALPSYISKSLHQQSNHTVEDADLTGSLSSDNLHQKESDIDAKVSSTLNSKETCLTAISGQSLTSTTVNQAYQVNLDKNTRIHGQDMNGVSSSSRNSDIELSDPTAGTHSVFSSFLKNSKQADSDKVEEANLTENDPVTKRHSSCEEAREATDDLNCSQKYDKQHKTSKMFDASIISESEPSFEIDIEKLDTSVEEDSSSQNSKDIQHNQVTIAPLSDECNKNLLEATSCTVQSALNTTNSENGELQSNRESTLSLASYKPEYKETTSQCTLESSSDVPLDMSVLKSCKQECDNAPLSQSVQENSMDSWSPLHKENEGSHFDAAQFSPYGGKRKMVEPSNFSTQGSRKSLFRLDARFGGKLKDETHASIPWQRRDMSRKEEYEFLELSPFCDLAEFSQRYPHVHQRTYYRWKRRIKEEYIILEQCPEMSFQEFSSVVLQAKESVFLHWKSLIAQGKGFFAPSDTSKRLEAKCSPKSGTHYNSEYTVIQKNLSLTYEQFSQQYPGTAVDTFNALKRKAMQEFWLFHQNQHMSYKDFSKLVNVNEDVFNVWKEYIDCLKSNPLSASLKAVSNSLSPNPPMSLSSFQSVGNPNSSGTDLHSQSPKDSLFNTVNSSAALKDSLAAVHAGALNSALNDSVARSLSSTYLASLQNMMFPWHSYYGLTAPLGQQMLPMMLWPGMMGLTSSINPLSLASGSHATGVSRTSSVTGLHSSLRGTVSESSESPKSIESQGKHQSESQHKSKRSANDGEQTVSKTNASSDGEKRLKLTHEGREEGDFWGSFSRSRKQNKQEYVYYLKNPELGFKELESLFPAISMRTFYRWRKEMNAAVLLLEDNKDMTFHQFQMVFPDIPEEIFESWKDRSKKETLSTHSEDSHQAVSPESNSSMANLSHDSQMVFGQAQALDQDKTDSADMLTNQISEDLGSQTGSEDTAHNKKCHKEEYLYVQRNPNIDFATFSKLYPNTSVRSFYRWKKELKDAIDYLKANPDIDFDSYKTMDNTVSEEIFRVWKVLICNEITMESDALEDTNKVHDRDAKLSAYLNRKLSGPEYWFLQLNPYIEFSQFSRTYPDVPKRTFYRWKQEIQQIMNYMRAQSSVQFSEIASVLPEVSMDAFLKWKDIIASETDNAPEAMKQDDNAFTEDTKPETPKNLVDEHAKNLMTQALLYLMYNPTIKYKQFNSQFEFVSAATFELWLNRIKTVVLHIAADPDMDYATFSRDIKDVKEDIFDIWKSLGPDEIAAMDLDNEENHNPENRELWQSFRQRALCNDKDISQSAFEFCQRNPNITLSSFQMQYPSISKEIFLNWLSRIQEELQYLKQNPSSEFEDFSKVHPFTKKEIFDQWKLDLNFSKDKFQDPNVSSMLEDGVSIKNISDIDLKHKLVHSKAPNLDTDKQHDSKEASHEKFYSSDIQKGGDCMSFTTENSFDRPTRLMEDSKESSLSKLAKFADSNAVSYSQKYLDDNSHKSHSSHIAEFVDEHMKSADVASSVIENLLKNNNNKSQSLHADEEIFLNSPSTAVTAQLNQLKKNTVQPPETNDSPQHTNKGSSQQHSSSLSALMAMSRTNEKVANGILACSPKKDQSGSNLSSVTGNLFRQGASNGSLTFVSNANLKEDDEGFSSQRQKKMSRAEYMFVKDNPDVDSQEFSRIFPGVSARTFYRWKKEIKAQLQLA